MNINNAPVKMEVDSGASCSIVNSETWSQISNSSDKLYESDLTLQTWSAQKLNVVGKADVHVEYGNFIGRLPLHVIDGTGCNLMGRSWFKKLGINIQGILSIETSLNVDELLRKHEKVFSNNLGMHNEIEIHIQLKEDARPVFQKFRQVPFAVRPGVEEEIEKLVQQDILEPVAYSDWATPLVVVCKKDGSIRLCGDYRSTVNLALKKNA